MERHGVEIEIQVPCAEGRTHPVRLRCTGWGKYEVVYNPCEELLGEVSARMARCTHYLHEGIGLKRRIVEALGAIGDSQVVPMLVEALGDISWRVRIAAAGALGELGDPQAVPALIKALGDRYSDVRRAAAGALGELGDPQAVPALIQALGDWNEDVRRAAAAALGELGDLQAIPRLKKMLKSRYSTVSAAAQRAIEQINAWSAHGNQP